MDGRIFYDLMRADVAGVVFIVVVAAIGVAAPFLAWELLRNLWVLVRYGPRAAFGTSEADPSTMRLLAVLLLVIIAVLLIAVALGMRI